VQYALTARRDDALIACWFIGLAADLTGLGYPHHASIGISALSMGLIALFIVSVRNLTFRDSVITQIFFCFAVSFLHAALVGAYARYAAPNHLPLWDVLTLGFYGAIYTALLAPYGHWLLRRLRGPLGLGAIGRVRVG
jgi:rod shape-determining protein MreD